MAEIRLASLTWPEAEELREQPGVIALIPLAAIEQHGRHLPLSTDVDIAERLASALADKLSRPALIIPVLPGGLSRQHLGFPGTVSLPQDVIEGYVEAYIETCRRLNVRDVALFSSHGGNFKFLELLIPGFTIDILILERQHTSISRGSSVWLPAQRARTESSLRRQTFMPAQLRQYLPRSYA